MENALFDLPNADVYLVVGILVFFGVLEAISGYLSRSQRKFSDWIQEAGGFFMLSLLIKPGIVLGVFYLGSAIFPQFSGLLNGWSLLAMTVFYLLIDDVLQYWYHRSAHEYEFLWKLHRPHHQAEEMGFFVSYRNAGMYYVLMPNLWWGAIVTFIGGAAGVALGLVLKQLITISSHSIIKWDKYFYKIKWLKPIIQVLERIIITPAFHYGHHSKTMLDGVGDPNGNYGNMFSFWDQLFGTAKFTHQYPAELGLPNDPKEEWAAAYFFPIVTSKNPNSEISRGYVKEDTKVMEPAVVELVKGKKYQFCACGKSKNQPFCDGTHHGSKFKPLLFEAKRNGKAKLCNCKLSKNAPFCDNSHLT